MTRAFFLHEVQAFWSVFSVFHDASALATAWLCPCPIWISGASRKTGSSSTVNLGLVVDSFIFRWLVLSLIEGVGALCLPQHQPPHPSLKSLLFLVCHNSTNRVHNGP